MGSGFRTWAAGEVATASNVMNYLMKQAVMSFASSAARAAAVTAPEDGMLSHQVDTDTFYGYDAGNTTWLAVASMRAWQSFTPTWTGSTTNPVLGNGTISAAYLQVGKMVRFRINITMGSTTTYGSGAYGLTLPVAPIADQTVAAVYVDSSATLRFTGTAWLTNASGIFRLTTPADAGAAGLAGTVPFAMATSDQIIVSGTYETA